jgi:aldehyde:ferredoxin oxidoreductase
MMLQWGMRTSHPITGYHGCYRNIDVATRQCSTVPLCNEVLRRTLGGSGLGTHLLLELGAAAHDPLSPAAALVFAFSPLVGSPLTTSAKFAVVSKSPLTERLNDSLSSSGFALAGKRSGSDALVITGRAAQLSIVVIDEDRVTIEPASDLAGLPCDQTEAALRTRLGNDFQFAVIGPAGERLVRYATISHDGRHAGRGGSGAVLGSKNIKAVAVRGNRRCTWANPQQLADYAKQLSARSFGPATAKYRELGTAANLLAFNRLGVLPTRNFQAGTFAEAAQLSPEVLSVSRSKTRASCAACTIGCEHIYALSPDANGGTATGVRLEYENLFALGPLCGIGNSETVLRASQLCDAWGLDTISTGGTIAFAMECAERGYLDAPELRFGNDAALLQTIEQIATRTGLGELLAEGSRRTAIAIGHNTIDFAPQVKGLEIPGYEPRALQTMALGFAVGTRGADHNRSGAYEVDFSEAVDRRNATLAAAAHAIETEDKAALMDSLILCKFLRGVFADFYAEAAEMLHLITDWQVTADELRRTAKNIVANKRRFNALAGWTQEEDTLPARFLNSALPDDPQQAMLSHDKLQSLIGEYHRLRAEEQPTHCTNR